MKLSNLFKRKQIGMDEEDFQILRALVSTGISDILSMNDVAAGFGMIRSRGDLVLRIISDQDIYMFFGGSSTENLMRLSTAIRENGNRKFSPSNIDTLKKSLNYKYMRRKLKQLLFSKCANYLKKKNGKQVQPTTTDVITWLEDEHEVF